MKDFCSAQDRTPLQRAERSPATYLSNKNFIFCYSARDYNPEGNTNHNAATPD
jgi:hypothetical protein